MYNLSSLLEKFKHLKNPKEERERLVATLRESVGFEIPFDAVDLRKGVIYLSVSPYIKTEVFIKKEHVLSVLKSKGFEIEDIR